MDHPWKKPLFAAFGLWCVLIVYDSFYFSFDWPRVFSESMAATGGFLIGLSFFASSLSYFFDVFDHMLSYRKALGLLGYAFALAYSVSLVVRFPVRYGTDLAQTLLEPEAQLGVAAMTIFTMMAIVSHRLPMQFLGPVLWRRILRIGYIAYAMLVIRAIEVEGGIWLSWLSDLEGLPPPRMLLSVFAVVVILARGLMWISLAVSKRNTGGR